MSIEKNTKIQIESRFYTRDQSYTKIDEYKNGSIISPDKLSKPYAYIIRY